MSNPLRRIGPHGLGMIVEMTTPTHPTVPRELGRPVAPNPMFPDAAPVVPGGLPEIVDGFLYDLNLGYWTERWEPLALAAMEMWRRAKSYRARWYVSPVDGWDVISAYQTAEEQLRVVPGTYILGWTACARNAAGAFITPDTMLVRIVEGATRIPLTDDFVNAAPWNESRGIPALLSTPRLVLEPGYINVEIANAGSTNLSEAQILIFCMEPCVLIHETNTECENVEPSPGGARW